MNFQSSFTSRHPAKITQLWLVALGVALLCAAGRAQAETTWYVSPAGDDSWSGANPECIAPDGPKAHIQAGIDAAVDGDTVLVADGTYTGVGNKNLNFGGKVITLRSASGDPSLCIINCEADGRGFYFGSGEGPDSVVAGLTIANGFLGVPTATKAAAFTAATAAARRSPTALSLKTKQPTAAAAAFTSAPVATRR